MPVLRAVEGRLRLSLRVRGHRGCGAKLLYLLPRLPQLAAELPLLWESPAAFAARWLSGGLVFYGGIFGGIAGAWLAARYFRADFGAFCPVLVPAVPLMHALGRVGCFFTGCCYGVELDPPWGIPVPAGAVGPGGVRFPVQLWEAGAEGVIFLLLLRYSRRAAPPGKSLAAYLLLYAPVRFVLEFFRGDPARGEWVRSVEEMPKEDYMPFFHQFNPVDFDPKQWARAAKEAGMKYVVLTAKHHDGFCLFDSQYTDFKSTNTPYGRDIVKEFVEAVRAEGLKVGLYFTLLDWYHDDYPHYGDKNHPMRNNPAYSNEKRDFSRYVEYMHNQVREICTNYGKLDILWFDFSYENENYVMRGETWGATELVNMVRELQPGIIIDNRLEVSGEGFGSLWECDPTPYHGDFVSPEQIIPPNGIQDKQGRDMVWEACVTMNNNWGYCANDHYFKPAPMLIKKLVECVSKGGNLLLNVGPDARGNIPPQSLEILRQIGAWMKDNSQSIYGCGKAGLEKPDNGRITRRGNKLYYHLFENTIGPMPLPGVKAEEVEYVRYLATGAEVPISNSWTHSNFPDIVFADLGPDPILPDPVDTVLEVTLKE